jgi:SH3-like domain-containing protein
MGPVTASAAPSTGSVAPNAQGNGNLVIGGRAVVLVDAGSSLNLRANPSASAQVRRTLKNQETVTIVSGPQLAEGFRWWQVRADSDGNTGWVVDSVQGANGPENTLSPIP